MYRATITVPTKQQNGAPVEDLEIVKKVVKKNLCEWFGGCTETAGNGSWVDGNGMIVSEEVTVFETLTDNEHVLPILEGLAAHVKNVCNQEAVLITVQTVDTVKFV